LRRRAPSQAQTVSDILSAELLPGWTTDSGTHMAAIRLTLSAGVETYWRSPGDAGIPPDVRLVAGPTTSARCGCTGPRPGVHFNGMQTIGYARELVLPVEIWPDRRPAHAAGNRGRSGRVPRHLRAGQLSLSSDLRVAPRPDNPAIRAALKARPATAREAGVKSGTSLHGHGGPRRPAPAGGAGHARAWPRRGGGDRNRRSAVWVAEATARREGRRLVAETDLVSHDRQPFALDRGQLTISVLAQGRAVEISGCPAP
jgi:hypothetical protein